MRRTARRQWYPFAQSSVGQNYGSFLREMGITNPADFAALDDEVQIFWMSWFNEKYKKRG